jgi:hypothetical protein
MKSGPQIDFLSEIRTAGTPWELIAFHPPRPLVRLHARLFSFQHVLFGSSSLFISFRRCCCDLSPRPSHGPAAFIPRSSIFNFTTFPRSPQTLHLSYLCFCGGPVFCLFVRSGLGLGHALPFAFCVTAFS